MKKYLFWLFGATLALTACNQNPAEQNVKMNDYEYLVDGLMRFDDEGNITGYMIGDNLNQADPLEISVPVKNYEEAVAIFRSLLPENANVKQEDKKYSWLMTDSLGGTIGELTLDTLEDGIAIMTMKGPKIEPAPAKRIKAGQRALKCHFIPESAWPENSSAVEEILKNEYYLGAIVNKSKDDGFGSGTFVVIAPWTPQSSGLMIKLAPNASYFDDMPKKKCSSLRTVHRVYTELHQGNNYHDIFEVIGQKPEVNWPETLGGWYLTKTKKGNAYYCVNLDTNNEMTYNPDSGRKIDSAPAHRAPAADAQKLRMAYCYYFKPDGDKIKFW